jgi:hypothetical protein
MPELSVLGQSQPLYRRNRALTRTVRDTFNAVKRRIGELVFLLEAATRMKQLRAICESAAPEPLRTRGLYSPRDFLTFV